MTLKILPVLCFIILSGSFYGKDVKVSSVKDIKVNDPGYQFPDTNSVTASYSTDVSESFQKNNSSQTIFFTEDFEDTDFADRGWYDNTNFNITKAEAHSGTSSAEFHFAKGATSPESGGSIRRVFNESASVYISYRVKYSENWQEQPGGYGHHEFHFLTNKDGHWTGPAFTFLTVYIENHDLKPVFSIQDGKNIDQSQIGSNLTGVSENRAVAGCNGDSDGLGNSNCYRRGGLYWNGKIFPAGSKSIKLNQWHRVEVFFSLNTISNGIGQQDGVIKYWLDGSLIINHENVVFRTGAHVDMLFNQFIVAPFLGNGSPNNQTFWIDDLVIANDRIE